MYAGIRNHWSDIHPAEEWLNASHIQEYHEANISINQVLAHRDVFSYKVFIPSFLGEAKFLLITHANQIPHWSSLILHQTPQIPQMNGIQSHLTHDVWMAYYTWNRYHFPGVALDAEGVFHVVQTGEDSTGEDSTGEDSTGEEGWILVRIGVVAGVTGVVIPNK